MKDLEGLKRLLVAAAIEEAFQAKDGFIWNFHTNELLNQYTISQICHQPRNDERSAVMAKLIVAAVNALPGLIAEIERLHNRAEQVLFDYERLKAASHKFALAERAERLEAALRESANNPDCPVRIQRIARAALEPAK